MILVKANGCGACNKLKELWPKILPQLKRVIPDVQIVEITLNSTRDKIDTNVYPKVLQTYIAWFPMLFAVSGNVWESAMKDKSAPLLGLRIMNGEIKDGRAAYVKSWDTTKAESFGEWLALIKDELTTSNEQQIKVPTSKPAEIIKPLLGASIKPNLTGNSDFIGTDNVCSLNLVPRPK